MNNKTIPQVKKNPVMVTEQTLQELLILKVGLKNRNLNDTIRALLYEFNKEEYKEEKEGDNSHAQQ